MLKVLADKFRASCAAACVAAGLFSASPANAVVYAGAWDPSFGAAFPDLGWRGEAKFFVPDACLSQSVVFFFSPCTSQEEMKLLSAEVEFYKLSDPNNAAFQETLSFDIPSELIVSMQLTNGVLSGVFGTFNPQFPVPSTLAIAGGPYTDFLLFFEGNIARMAFHTDPPYGKDIFGFSDKNPPDGTPFITFSVVSEPSAFALLAVAVGLILLGLRGQKASLRAASPI